MFDYLCETEMAVRIRLQRRGRRNKAFFWVVVADSHTARDGKIIERLGYFDPVAEPPVVNVRVERAAEWLKKGAQPTEAARAILRKAGVFHFQFLMRGVEKGVLTEQQARECFARWVAEKAKRLHQKTNQTATQQAQPSPEA